MAFPLSPFQFSFTNPMTQDERRKINLGDTQFPRDEDQNSGSPFQDNVQPHPQQDIMDAYREILNRKEGPAMMNYRKYLAAAPQEADYKPGKLTRLGAILSGAATGFQNPAIGAEVAQRQLRAPFERAVDRYKMQGEGLEKLAGLEESQYQHKIQAVKNIADFQKDQETTDRENRLADSLIKSRIDQAKNAGHQVIKGDDGHYYSVDKNTAEKTDLGKLSLSEDEKSQRKTEEFSIEEGTRQKGRKEMAGINFGNAKTLQEIRDREAAARAERTGKDAAQRAKDLEDQRQKNRIELNDLKNKQINDRVKLRTDESIRKSLATKGLSGTTSTINSIRSNMREVSALYDTDPTRYGKVWDDSALDMKKPPDINSPEYADYVKIYNALYAGTGHQLSSKPEQRKIPIVRK